MHYEHIPFSDFRYSKALRSHEFTDFSYVELAKHRKKKAPKILFVLDYTPRESLRSAQLLKGPTGELLSNIIEVATDVYGAPSIDDRDWLAVSYHSLKTQGMSDGFKEEAHRDFKKRLDYIITQYKPEVVMTFGPDPYKALNGEFLEKYKGKDGVQYQHFYGVPIETTVKHKDAEHKFQHVPTVSLHTLLTGDNKGGSLAVIGYAGRNMTTALNQGKLVYEIPKLKYEIEVVDTIKKFNAMYKDICAAKVVAIDSETKNLYKRMNATLTWQFSTRADHAYILPFLHKDSTFLPEEIAYIKKKLRLYFERTNKNKVQIYANAAFDMNCARRDLGVRYFKSDIWDVFAGEFAIDENMKFLQSVVGKNYYSLLNITMQYGCKAYYESDFGKEKRATIVDQDLEGPVLTYMALDVIVLHHIRKLQIKKAKDFGYEKYQSVVSEQLSDLVHALGNLEYNGAYIDIDWLFKLKSQDSPIVSERARVIKALNATKGVQKTNTQLIKESGAPAVGLFGRVNLQIFNIRKEEHKQKLFFEVLGLKPIFMKKDGTGKIDKDFQEKYKDVEEVKLYNELTKLNKLYNAYVKSFIRQWGADADMRYDTRIRPRFGYLDVVTGRTSAKKPSLQQIPSRGEMGKNIKRLFVAEKGRLIIKVDYAAHEVRGWSIISGDVGVADAFRVGLDLREKFKIKPTPELGAEIELKGDVHKINAAYFFRMNIEDVDKPKRNSVKQVIFGLIYQQSAKGTAKSIKATVEEVEDLTKKFFKRFPVGAGWFDLIKQKARQNLFVESPLGRRRNLWGLLVPKSHENHDPIFARNERQSVNSPVQGMGSDFMMIGARNIERLKYEHYDATGHYPDFYQANSVHDSLEFSCAYEDFWLAIKIIENGLTHEVAKVVKARHAFDLIIPLEIDFDVGHTLKDCEGWNYALTGKFPQKDKESLDTLLEMTLQGQIDDLGHKIDKAKILKLIHSGFEDHAPEWAHKQKRFLEKKGNDNVFSFQKAKDKKSKDKKAKKKSSLKKAA